MSHAATDTGNYQLESARWSKGRNALVLLALISIIACIAGYIQPAATAASSAAPRTMRYHANGANPERRT